MNLGLDLLDIARMERRLTSEGFMRRCFTAEERAYIARKGAGAAQTAAGIFCAKEALAKATGTPLLRVLRHSEVLHTASGQPYFNLPGVSLSISHTAATAAAVVLCTTAPEGDIL